MDGESEELFSDSNAVSTSKVHSSLCENDDDTTVYSMSSVMILLVIGNDTISHARTLLVVCYTFNISSASNDDGLITSVITNSSNMLNRH